MPNKGFRFGKKKRHSKPRGRHAAKLKLAKLSQQRNMETESLIPAGNIKQEPDYEVKVKDAAKIPTLRIWYLTRIGRGPGGEDVLQSHVFEAHSDDVGTLPNRGCSTEADQMFSLCEMNTELCVAGTSCGAQRIVEIKTHQKIHNTGKCFTCDVCGVRFTQFRNLKIHKKTHTGEKPYQCDVCGLGFTQNCSLKYHIMRNHTGERPYKCDLCGVGFALGRNLKEHKRTHTGEKPYKCDLCCVGFARSGHLKRHTRTHTGEKPYKCDICGVSFARTEHLKTHTRTHTREKPYKCEVCGVRFVYIGHLKRHKSIHTEVKI